MVVTRSPEFVWVSSGYPDLLRQTKLPVACEYLPCTWLASGPGCPPACTQCLLGLGTGLWGMGVWTGRTQMLQWEPRNLYPWRRADKVTVFMAEHDHGEMLFLSWLIPYTLFYLYAVPFSVHLPQNTNADSKKQHRFLIYHSYGNNNVKE